MPKPEDNREYQLFVRWDIEGEGYDYDMVELVKKDDGFVVLSSGVFHNNRDRGIWFLSRIS